MKAHLRNKKAFQEALKNYKVSEKGRILLRQTKLVLLVSVTSAGRNTIINELVKTGQYKFIISDTTRPKRQNNGVWEQDGVEYWFRDEDDVLHDLQQGLFVEAEIIHEDWVSGISVRELQLVIDDHKIAINEVDHEGIANIVEAKPDTFALMVLPPNAQEWMKRLHKRGDMDDEEVENRINTAKRILTAASERTYYKLIVNDELDDAVAAVRRIVEDGHYSEDEHQKGLEVAKEILQWIETRSK